MKSNITFTVKRAIRFVENYSSNSISLWDAVSIAKDVNVQQMPNKMYRNNVLIDTENLPDQIASFLKDKVQNIVIYLKIDNAVYNGTQNFLHMLKIS